MADEKKPEKEGSHSVNGAGVPPRFVRFDEDSPSDAAGLGPGAGGQSGDTMGLPREEISGPESIEELAEEGQAFEAEVLDGVENAPDADQGEIRTRQVPEDDVPQEYLDGD
jgi:hypothetical protein